MFLPQITPCRREAGRGSPAVEIRAITRPDELEAVARLRYEIYVEELGYAQPSADPGSRTIHEPVDSEGLVLGAFFADGRLLGSIRIAPSEAPGLSSPEIYRWEQRRRSAPGQVFHASKLLVAHEERGSRIGFQLIRAAALAALRLGWRYAFLECYPHLVPLYERIGFQLRAQASDPVFGSVTIMEWDLGDLEHLRRIRSPMLAVLVELLEQGRAVSAIQEVA